jgi:ubiquinone/menaquinone biosynthesis C-methylase UbiE
MARVLAPGGRFYFEEFTAHALARPTYQRLFDHPTEDRFTAEQFLDELVNQGLVVLGSTTRIFGDYLLGVAAEPEPTRSNGRRPPGE